MSTAISTAMSVMTAVRKNPPGAPRREKIFGHGRPRALDRNAKIRIMTRARGLVRRTQKGKHYGVLTAKMLAVLEALLWGFHNAASGRCFPSYAAIADKAGCARSTVAAAIKALEGTGLLSWVNRIVRVREKWAAPGGAHSLRWRVIRTSNAYHFNDIIENNAVRPSKSEYPTGTMNQVINPLSKPPAVVNPSLEMVLLRLKQAVEKNPNILMQ